MQLAGKRVIVIGERDGVQGPAIEACVRSASSVFTVVPPWQRH